MSYIIWDGADCVIFSSKRRNEAFDYVWNNKSISLVFDDWIQSVTTGNQIAIINQFDTKMPYTNAPRYLQSQEQS